MLEEDDEDVDVRASLNENNEMGSSSREAKGQEAFQCVGVRLSGDGKSGAEEKASGSSTTQLDSNWYFLPCRSVMPFVCQAEACLKGYFRCLDGSCVSQKYICDGKYDCKDRSDEANCEDKNCHHYLSGASGLVKSPNFPENYPPLINCKWVLEGPVGTKIKLQFEYFLTELTFDTLLILGASTNEAESVEISKLSGNKVNETLTEYYSPNHILILKFSTDEELQFPGFSIRWTAIKIDCIENLEAGNRFRDLRSPNYPRDYMNGMECVWIISTPDLDDNQIMTLKMRFFETESDFDYLEVRDGKSPDSPLLATYSGSAKLRKLPSFIISTGPYLYLYFYSDSTISGKGFDLSYKIGCDNVLYDTHELLYSPGQGLSTYPKFQDCVWEIDVTNTSSNLTLYIDKYDIHYTDLLRITSYQSGFTDKDHDKNKENQEILLFDSSKMLSEESLLLSKFVIPFGKAKVELFTDAVGFGTGYIASYSIAFNTTLLAAFIKSAHLPRRVWLITVKAAPTPISSLVQFQNPNCPRLEDYLDNALNSMERKVRVSTNETSFKTVVELTCSKGHKFSNGDTRMIIYCKTGGEWNLKAIPNCIAQEEDTGCGPVNQIPNAIIYGASNVSVGGVATHICLEGFTFPSGENIAYSECDKFGHWQNLHECIPIKNCKPQYLLRNGFITLVSGNGTSSGTILKMQCFKGFLITGSPITRCVSNGKWSHRLPQCQPIICPLPRVENAFIKRNFNSKAGEKFIYGRSVQVVCHPGYRINGPGALTCHPLGTKKDDNRDFLPNADSKKESDHLQSFFTTSIPTCEDIDECGENPYICDIGSTECLNLIGGYECLCKTGRFYDIGTSTSITGSNEDSVCKVPSYLTTSDSRNGIPLKGSDSKNVNLLAGIPAMAGEQTDIDEYFNRMKVVLLSNAHTTYKVYDLRNSFLKWQRSPFNEQDSHFPFMWCLDLGSANPEEKFIHSKIKIALPNSYVMGKMYMQIQLFNSQPLTEDYPIDDLIPYNIINNSSMIPSRKNAAERLLTESKISMKYSKNGLDYFWLTNSTAFQTPLSINLRSLYLDDQDSVFGHPLKKSKLSKDKFYYFDFRENSAFLEASHVEINVLYPNIDIEFYQNKVNITTVDGVYEKNADAVMNDDIKNGPCLAFALSGCRRYECPISTDPCSNENKMAGCSHICSPDIRSDVGYTCSCPPGWTLFIKNGTEGITVPVGETGKSVNDIFRINHTCIRKSCGTFPLSKLSHGQLYIERVGAAVNGSSSPYIGYPEENLKNINYWSNQESLYYFQDKIKFECNVGYIISGYDISECSIHGTWTNLNPEPHCNFAFCQTIKIDDHDSTDSEGGLSIISGAPFVSYGSAIRFECKTPGFSIGNTAYSGHRFCMYNPTSNMSEHRGMTGKNNDKLSKRQTYENSEYWISGTPPKCKPIDCGSPPVMSLSHYRYTDDQIGQIDGIPTAKTRNKYYYGSSFEFMCLSGGIILGQSSKGDNVVRCDIDGIWDFGDLRCKGPACNDPGTPLYGTQISDSYEIGSVVKFACNKNGYFPSFKAIKCIMKELDNHTTMIPMWNISNSIPVCLDKQPPVFLDNPLCTPDVGDHDTTTSSIKMKELYLVNTTNGPQFENEEDMPAKILLNINQFREKFDERENEVGLYPSIVAKDNSGRVVKYEIDPPYFLPPPFHAKQNDMVVTYKAYDGAGNVGRCRFKIVIKDITPPLITCPPSYTHYLTLNESLYVSDEDMKTDGDEMYDSSMSSMDDDYENGDNFDGRNPNLIWKQIQKPSTFSSSLPNNNNNYHRQTNGNMEGRMVYFDVGSKFPISAVDDSGDTPVITYNYENPHKVAVPVSSFVLIVVTATDKSENSAFCSFHITVKPNPCSGETLLSTSIMNYKFYKAKTNFVAQPFYRCYIRPSVNGKDNRNKTIVPDDRKLPFYSAKGDGSRFMGNSDNIFRTLSKRDVIKRRDVLNTESINETICEFKCPEGYIFLADLYNRKHQYYYRKLYGHINLDMRKSLSLVKKIEYKCSKSSRKQWSPLKYVPLCIQFHKALKPSHTITMSIQYRSANNEIEIADISCLKYYRDMLILSGRIKKVSQDLTEVCKKDGINSIRVIFNDIDIELNHATAIVHYHFLLMEDNQLFEDRTLLPYSKDKQRDYPEKSDFDFKSINKCTSALQLVLDLKLSEIRSLMKLDLNMNSMDYIRGNSRCPPRIYASYTHFLSGDDWCPADYVLYKYYDLNFNGMAGVLSDQASSQELHNNDKLNNNLMLLTSNSQNIAIKRCIKCPMGTFSTNDTCVSCPIGTYQDRIHQMNCKVCPAGMSTETSNIYNIDQCKLMCIPGTYSSYSNNDDGIRGGNGGLIPCTACQKNTFSRLYGSPICIPCPGQRITSGIGASSNDYCIEPCPAGFYSSTGQMPCQPCPKNFYQPTLGSTFCHECPDILSTATRGSNSLEKCYSSSSGHHSKMTKAEPKRTLLKLEDSAHLNKDDSFNNINVETDNFETRRQFYDNSNNSIYSSDDLGRLYEGEYFMDYYANDKEHSRPFNASIDLGTMNDLKGNLPRRYPDVAYEFIKIPGLGSRVACERYCWDIAICSGYKYLESLDVCKLFNIPKMITNHPNDANRSSYQDELHHASQKVVKRHLLSQEKLLKRSSPSSTTDKRIILIRDLTGAHFCSFQNMKLDDVKGIDNDSRASFTNYSMLENVTQYVGCSNGKVLTFLDVTMQAILKMHPSIENAGYGGRNETVHISKYISDLINTSFARFAPVSSQTTNKSRTQYISTYLLASSHCRKIFDSVSQIIHVTEEDGAGEKRFDLDVLLRNFDFSRSLFEEPDSLRGSICQVYSKHGLLDRIKLKCEGQASCVISYPVHCLTELLSPHLRWMEAQNISDILGTRIKLTMDCVSNPCDRMGTNFCLNGGICKTVNHKVICECPLNYVGQKCEKYVSFCLSAPCLNGGTCSDAKTLETILPESHQDYKDFNTPKYVCKCPAGFSGDFCEITKDYCSSNISNNPCLNDGMCKNEATGYSCLCRQGFIGDNCEMVSEGCLTFDPCKNKATCKKLPLGRHKCLCSPGWEGEFCDKSVDDCLEKPCGLNAKCVDGHRRYYCKCPLGFTGMRCTVKISICALDRNNQLCNPAGGVGSYIKRGTCYDTPLGYKCMCRPGFTGKNCEGMIDWCSYSPCQNLATCLNSGFSFKCICQKEFTGSLCQHNAEDCEQIPCLNGGRCVRQPDGKKCVCPYGFTGERCKDTDEACSISSCYPNNTKSCIKVNTNEAAAGYICECKNNYSGDYCEKSLTRTSWDDGRIDPCFGVVCENGGKCEPKLNITREVLLIPSNINKSQQEENSDNTYLCMCASGWEGKHCERMVSMCHLNRSSIYEHGSTILSHSKTTSGSGSQNNRCSLPNTPCLDLFPNDYYCQCPINLSSFSSPNSHLYVHDKTRFPKDRWILGKSCDIVDPTNNPCSGNPCMNGGTCNYFAKNRRYNGGKANINNVMYTVTCTCPLGSFGQYCEIKRDPCEAKPCQNAGRCVNTNRIDHDRVTVNAENTTVPKSFLTSYICECPTGLTGFHCETNPNDCKSYSCPPSSRCIDGLNTFYCECPLDKSASMTMFTPFSQNYSPNETQNTKDYKNCDKSLTDNFDLLFFDVYKNGSATFIFPQRLSLSKESPSFSLTVWVKFSVPEDSGVFVTLLEVPKEEVDSTLTDVSYRREKVLLSLDHFGIRLALFETDNEYYYSSSQTSENDNMGGKSRRGSRKEPSSGGSSSSQLFIPYDPFVINDGAWHHITFVYLKGKYGIIVDSEPLAHGSSEDEYYTLPSYVRIVLGDPKRYITKRNYRNKMGQGFNGVLTSVQLWGRPLKFPEELDDGGKCRNSITSKNALIIPWSAFTQRIDGKVEISWKDSSASSYCLNEDQTFIPGVSMDSVKPRSRMPVLTRRLDNIRIILKFPKKETLVTWQEPVFLDSQGRITKIEQNYFSGDYFTWGIYRVKYLAFDKLGNYASAQFKISIVKHDCPSIMKPPNLVEECGIWGQSQFYDSKRCSIRCRQKDANTSGLQALRRFSTPIPSFFSCSEDGIWRPSQHNFACLLTSSFRYPHCSDTVETAVEYIEMTLKYSAKNLCRDSRVITGNEYIRNLEKRVIVLVKNLIKDNQDLCLLIDCSYFKDDSDIFSELLRLQGSLNYETRIICGKGTLDTEKKNTVDHKYSGITLHRIRARLLGKQESVSRTNLPDSSNTSVNIQHRNKLMEWLQIRITNPQSEFNDVSDSAGKKFSDGSLSLKLIPNAFSIEVINLCATGFSLMNNECVKCAIGTYFDLESKSCEFCPYNTYQNKEGQLICHQCPIIGSLNRTGVTLCQGSSSKDDCKESCDAGYYLKHLTADTSNNDMHCEPCPMGFHQPDKGSFHCYPCDIGFTTHATGNNVEYNIINGNRSADNFVKDQSGHLVPKKGCYQPCYCLNGGRCIYSNPPIHYSVTLNTSGIRNSFIDNITLNTVPLFEKESPRQPLPPTCECLYPYGGARCEVIVNETCLPSCKNNQPCKLIDRTIMKKIKDKSNNVVVRIVKKKVKKWRCVCEDRSFGGKKCEIACPMTCEEGRTKCGVDELGNPSCLEYILVTGDKDFNVKSKPNLGRKTPSFSGDPKSTPCAVIYEDAEAFKNLTEEQKKVCYQEGYIINDDKESNNEDADDDLINSLENKNEISSSSDLTSQDISVISGAVGGALLLLFLMGIILLSVIYWRKKRSNKYFGKSNIHHINFDNEINHRRDDGTDLYNQNSNYNNNNNHMNNMNNNNMSAESSSTYSNHHSNNNNLLLNSGNGILMESMNSYYSPRPDPSTNTFPNYDSPIVYGQTPPETGSENTYRQYGFADTCLSSCTYKAPTHEGNASKTNKKKELPEHQKPVWADSSPSSINESTSSYEQKGIIGDDSYKDKHQSCSTHISNVYADAKHPSNQSDTTNTYLKPNVKCSCCHSDNQYSSEEAHHTFTHDYDIYESTRHFTSHPD
ncbi:uncharacterized protein LOC135930938 [Gordionus sp. m RMFG-2023]|uniref:uncharacterized protein LOC135930938 n=1 Tax=Gordionus sp. m RMFG-2023 TaxID=3053472 RepID=UPI0031FCC56D